MTTSGDVMEETNRKSIIAVDVGNARIKFGLMDLADFENPACRLVPSPIRKLHASAQPLVTKPIAEWIHGIGKNTLQWWIGSVNREPASALIEWIRINRPRDSISLLTAADLDIRVAVERPDMVGVDRLIDAVAANYLRGSGKPAVVVDVGTAITVDLVSDEGVFLGGAILPGIGMSARALHEFTDLLPLIDMVELTDPPELVGKSTVSAMRSGLFWAAVGSIRQLTSRMAEEMKAEPQIFLTGGAGKNITRLLGGAAEHVPNLTLVGIAMAAKRCS